MVYLQVRGARLKDTVDVSALKPCVLTLTNGKRQKSRPTNDAVSDIKQYFKRQRLMFPFSFSFTRYILHIFFSLFQRTSMRSLQWRTLDDSWTLWHAQRASVHRRVRMIRSSPISERMRRLRRIIRLLRKPPLNLNPPPPPPPPPPRINNHRHQNQNQKMFRWMQKKK